jgi:hypothetical protein
VTNLLTDLVMRPEFMHKIVSKLTDIEIDLVRQYEALNLFEPAPDLIHCSVAYNDILPAEGFDPDHVRPQDVWGRGVAQIFTSVSPEMHDEFDMEYMKRILAPFGMVYYGCCEALHNKIHIVEKIPNLRKISITPWADVDMSADQMGKKYVLSAKPNPAYVGTPRTDKDVVRREVLHILEACRRNGTPCELTLKDISTVAYRPENLFDWEKTVMETVKSF